MLVLAAENPPRVRLPRGTLAAADGNVNVFVVEDAPLVRQRLLALLGSVPGVVVVGEADSVEGAIAGVLAADVDAVLLDLQLIGGSGLDVLAAIMPLRPNLQVIVLSNFFTDQHRRASLAAGANVFLDKSSEFGLVPNILRGWQAALGQN